MSTPSISGQFPSPGQTDVGLRPQFQFTINDTGGGIDFSSLQFWVNGTLAYDASGGGFQPGYVASVDWNVGGFVNPFPSVGPASFIFAALNQVAFLPDTSLITLRVRVADTGDLNFLDTTWTFNTAVSAAFHNPYIINPSSDGLISGTPYQGVETGNDPLRFDLIVDPIVGNTLDLTTLSISLSLVGTAVIGGVTQPGFVFNTLAIPGGIRCEVQTSPPTFIFWNGATVHVAGTQPFSTFNGGVSITTAQGPVGPWPPNADPFFSPSDLTPFPSPGTVPPNWVGLQPTSGFFVLASGLGAPVIDTVVVVKNADPPVTIYDAGMGGFQLGWTGSQGPVGPFGPYPEVRQLLQQMLFGHTGPFAVAGDTLTFTVTGHKVSPDTGFSYPLNGFSPPSFVWNVVDSLTSTPTPPSGSIGQPTNLVWQVVVTDTLFSAPITFNSLMVTITPLVGPPVTSTVYTGGAFQLGWTGAGSTVIGQGTPSVTIQVDKSVPYNPGDHVSFFALDAQSVAYGLVAPSGPFTFDVTAPPPPSGPPLKVIGNGTGPIDGGTDLLLLGGVLDTTGCSDPFTSGMIGAMWTQVTAGSGALLAVIEDHAIRMDTGTTFSSVAALRTVGTVSDVDVETDFVPQSQLVQAGGVAVIAALALVVVPDVTEFRLQVEANLTGYQLRILVLLSGQTLVNQTQGIQTSGPGLLGMQTPRLIRFGARVIGLLNGAKVVDLGWAADAAKIEVSVRNDPAVQTRAVTEVTGYRRTPQITLGTEPVVDFAVRALAADTVQVRVPPVDVPAVVDILVRGCTTSDSVVQGFTYTIGNRLVVEQTTATKFTVLNDAALKET